MKFSCRQIDDLAKFYETRYIMTCFSLPLKVFRLQFFVLQLISCLGWVLIRFLSGCRRSLSNCSWTGNLKKWNHVSFKNLFLSFYNDYWSMAINKTSLKLTILHFRRLLWMQASHTFISRIHLLNKNLKKNLDDKSREWLC